MRISDWSSDVCSSDLGAHGRFDPVHRVDRKLGGKRDIVVATVVPGGDTSSITLACEPETASWTDWLRVDHGANLETIEAITRAITRRVAEHRRGEKEVVRDTASARELSEAKLSLLNAQVEPHFLYNRSEEHTSELQSLMRISYAVFCLKKKKYTQ